jgi:multidrug resistance efflux pump
MIDKIKNNLTALIATVGLIGTIGTGFVKYGEIMAKIDSIDPDKFAATVKAYDNKMAKYETNIKINEKEIELLKAQIQELKIKSGNPLAN